MKRTIVSIVFIVLISIATIVVIFSGGINETKSDAISSADINNVIHVSNLRNEEGYLQTIDTFRSIYESDHIQLIINQNNNIEIINDSNGYIQVMDTYVFDKYVNGVWYAYYYVTNEFFKYFGFDQYGRNERLEALDEAGIYAFMTRIFDDFTIEPYSQKIINFDNHYIPNFASGKYRLRLPAMITFVDIIRGSSQGIVYDLVYVFNNK